jgi:hypothetical protein
MRLRRSAEKPTEDGEAIGSGVASLASAWTGYSFDMRLTPFLFGILANFEWAPKISRTRLAKPQIKRLITLFDKIDEK